VWVPTFFFERLGTAVDQDVVSIVVLMLAFVAPLGWACATVAGRTQDEARRLRWLVGFALVAAGAGWLIVAFAGDVFTCGGKEVAPTATDVVCASSLVERVVGVGLVEALVIGSWLLARRESYRRR
jgi:hypothetical protein